MPTRTHRPTTAALLLLPALAALTLSGCFTPPPIPSSAPNPPATSAPTDPTPVPSSPASSPAPTPSATAVPGASGDLPELVSLNAPLPDGAQAGWETGIITDSAFTARDDQTFPAGPTISVQETATGCTFWAYQGQQDHDSTDEVENSAVTLGILSDSSPDDWEPDVVETAPSPSQGSAVEFLSIIQEHDDGTAEAWFARNFQSSRTTSSIVAQCPAGAGGIDHIDEVVYEHFMINFLLP